MMNTFQNFLLSYYKAETSLLVSHHIHNSNTWPKNSTLISNFLTLTQYQFLRKRIGKNRFSNSFFLLFINLIFHIVYKIIFNNEVFFYLFRLRAARLQNNNPFVFKAIKVYHNFFGLLLHNETQKSSINK